MNETLATELRELLNRHSQENASNTPDFILNAVIHRATSSEVGYSYK